MRSHNHFKGSYGVPEEKPATVFLRFQVVPHSVVHQKPILRPYATLKIPAGQEERWTAYVPITELTKLQEAMNALEERIAELEADEERDSEEERFQAAVNREAEDRRRLFSED